MPDVVIDTHPRQILVDAVCTRLLTPIVRGTRTVYPTMAAANVERARAWKLTQKDLPHCGVFIGEEDRVGLLPRDDVEDGDDGWGPTTRDAVLVIDGSVRRGTDVDARMEAFAYQVECALALDFAVPGFETAVFDYLKTEKFISSEGPLEIGVCRLHYRIRYRWTPPVPDDDATLPTVILGAWAPRIGPDYVAEYVELTPEMLAITGGVPALP